MQFVLVVLLKHCSRCDAVDGAWLQCNAVARGLKIRHDAYKETIRLSDT